MNYCSHCGSDKLVQKVPSGDSVTRYICEFCHTVHYQNPKIVVGCLPLYDNKILLCKRAIEPRKGTWNLPAGFMENGETVEEGAIRETFEEAMVKVKIRHLHCVYTLSKFNHVYLLFLADIITPDFSPGEETLEVHLFDPDEIPDDEIGFVSSSFALEKYFENQNSTKTHIGSFSGGF